MSVIINEMTMIQFLANSRLSVLATLMPDGTPHASVMHYSVNQKPLQLFYSTDDRSVKVQNCHRSNRASVTVGWSEANWITIQLRGRIEVVPAADIALVKSIHYGVHPNSQKFENDPNTIFLAFTPEWVRYSDLGGVAPIVQEWQW